MFHRLDLVVFPYISMNTDMLVQNMILLPTSRSIWMKSYYQINIWYIRIYQNENKLTKVGGEDNNVLKGINLNFVSCYVIWLHQSYRDMSYMYTVWICTLFKRGKHVFQSRVSHIAEQIHICIPSKLNVNQSIRKIFYTITLVLFVDQVTHIISKSCYTDHFRLMLCYFRWKPVH